MDENTNFIQKITNLIADLIELTKILYINKNYIYIALIVATAFITTLVNYFFSPTNPLLSTTTNIDYQISATYLSAGTFSEDLAPVRSSDTGNMLYIDRNGKPIINEDFDGALPFSKSDKLALVWKRGKNRGYINKEGVYVIPPQYPIRAAANFSQGLARVCLPNCGYIDITGKEAIKRQFTGAGDFSEDGLAPVQRNSRWGYIDTNGNFIIQTYFEEAHAFSEKLAPVKTNANGQWGYINTNGVITIQPQFDSVSLFSEGLAAVKKGNKWGYIDISGKFIIQPQFDSASEKKQSYMCDVLESFNGEGVNCKNLDRRYDFSEGLAAVKKGNKWGYIDTSGKFIIQPQFDEAYKFSQNLAAVCMNNASQKRCGYIAHP